MSAVSLLSRSAAVSPFAKDATWRGQVSVPVRAKYGDGETQAIEVPFLWTGRVDGPTVVVQGGISAHREVATTPGTHGWWSDVVGLDRSVDLRRCRVLCVDWRIPTDWSAGVPVAVSSEDQADLVAGVLSHLGVSRVHAWVGASYGAMVGLAFAARHGERLDRLVAIAGAHKAHPLATAQRHIQREIVRLGLATGQADAALSLARQLAMTTYRGEAEFAQRFAGGPVFQDGRFQFPVEPYLTHAGQSFVEHFSPRRFLALSESIDLHDVNPGAIRVPTTLVGFSSDRLVPLTDLTRLQRQLKVAASLDVIATPYGHDGFLKESHALAPLLTQALALPEDTVSP